MYHDENWDLLNEGEEIPSTNIDNILYSHFSRRLWHDVFSNFSLDRSNSRYAWVYPTRVNQNFMTYTIPIPSNDAYGWDYFDRVSSAILQMNDYRYLYSRDPQFQVFIFNRNTRQLVWASIPRNQLSDNERNYIRSYMTGGNDEVIDGLRSLQGLLNLNNDYDEIVGSTRHLTPQEIYDQLRNGGENSELIPVVTIRIQNPRWANQILPQQIPMQYTRYQHRLQGVLNQLPEEPEGAELIAPPEESLVVQNPYPPAPDHVLHSVI